MVRSTFETILKISIVFSLFIIFSSCNEEKDEQPIINKGSINGVVQKGPFLNGSSIGIYELDNQYVPTGKVFTTQMEDNSGTFKVNNVSLNSPYVQLKADGFYFNEVEGGNSQAPITLYALSDIKNKSSVNVNVISHLEKSRIEFLLERGLPFSDAKKQANQEVLKIFSINKPDIVDSDLLDISQEGDDNAILLAISLITQGFRTEAQLSELMANIITDFKQDGEMSDASIGTSLVNEARVLDLPNIRKQIEARYEAFGMAVEIPDFEKYVKLFIDSTNYEITNQITYPEFSAEGENILFGDKSVINSNVATLAAVLTDDWRSSVKLVIKNGEYHDGHFMYWNRISDDGNPVKQYETHNPHAEDKIVFDKQQTLYIEIYENYSLTPTRTKTVTIIPPG